MIAGRFPNRVLRQPRAIGDTARFVEHVVGLAGAWIQPEQQLVGAAFKNLQRGTSGTHSSSAFHSIHDLVALDRYRVETRSF